MYLVNESINFFLNHKSIKSHSVMPFIQSINRNFTWSIPHVGQWVHPSVNKTIKKKDRQCT